MDRHYERTDRDYLSSEPRAMISPTRSDIEMREGLKGDRFDLRSPPPDPLAPRALRFGIRERIRPNSDLLIPLDADTLGEAIAAIRNSGVTSVASVSCIPTNPAHEIEGGQRQGGRAHAARH